jgi:hypothetical protein
MAFSATTSTSKITIRESFLNTEVRSGRRRIHSEAGRALEILTHSIEYLADEYVQDKGTAISVKDGRLLAIQILMAANREVYFSCPELPSIKERLRSLVKRFANPTRRDSDAGELSVEARDLFTLNAPGRIGAPGTLAKGKHR